MLDIQFIRDNPELVAEKSKHKGYDVDIQQLLGFDGEGEEEEGGEAGEETSGVHGFPFEHAL